MGRERKRGRGNFRGFQGNFRGRGGFRGNPRGGRGRGGAIEEKKEEGKGVVEKVVEEKGREKEGNKLSRIHSHQEKRRAIDHAYWLSCSEDDDEEVEWVGPKCPKGDDDFE